MEDRSSMLVSPIDQGLRCVDWNTVQACSGAGWQFSAGPSIPEWPQTARDITSTSFETGDIMGNTWGFSDDFLFDAHLWADWDLGHANFATPNLDSQARIHPEETSISPTPLPQFHSSEVWDNQACLTGTTDIKSKSFDDIGSFEITTGEQRANAKLRRSRRPPGRRSALLMRPSGQTVKSLPGAITVGQMPEDCENKRHTSEKGDMPSPLLSTASPSLVDQPGKKRYHKDTERQYRMRLNERYFDLLKALPDDLVGSAGGQSGRSQADKGLSKIEILALAKSHIASLEQTQAELEQESLVLRGQQDLFKRLCGGGAGCS